LPYYNASNPTTAYSGPGGTGTAQNTKRAGQCVVSVKSGAAATTGTQTTPAPDAGCVGAWVVTVANGQTTITAGNISGYANAPFMPSGGLLVGGLQYNGANSSVAGGTADAITGSFTPGITGLASGGLTLYVRAGNANATTTPTFTPAPGVIAAKTIVKGNGLALAPGDIAGAGHWIELQYDLTLDKWVLQNPARGVIYGASLGTSGWTKLPSGLLVQWTTGVGSASGDVAASWPIAFPNALYSFSATAANGTGTTGTIAQVGAANTSSISVGTWQGSTPSRIVQAFYVMGVGS
jgi:hypothetical protein